MRKVLQFGGSILSDGDTEKTVHPPHLQSVYGRKLGPMSNAGGIDKLELRIPWDTEPRSKFFEAYAEAREHGKVVPSQHYKSRADMREFGFQSIVHFTNSHSKKGDHKLELVDVGEMSYQRIEHEVSEVFNLPGQRALDNLDVMRVDCCADLHSVSVPWMHERARMQYKGWAAKLGWIEYAEMGRRAMQTIYYGKRPNCLRIYDKTAELKAQYQKFRREWLEARRAPVAITDCSKGDLLTLQREVWRPHGSEVTDAEISELNREYRSLAVDLDELELDKLFKKFRREEIELMQREMPTFRELYGIPDDFVWTRCERQIGAGRVPKRIGSLKRLRVHAPDFNPFDKLILEAREQESKDEWSLNPNIYAARGGKFKDYCCGMYVRQLMLEHDARDDANKGHGAQWAYAFVKEFVGKNNVARTWERIKPFLPAAADERDGITSAAIYEIYREAVSQQLAA